MAPATRSRRRATAVPDEQPLPNDLITVPSCNKCNSGFSKDDEYFRNVIVVRKDVAGHKIAAEINKRIAEALKSPQRAKFKSYLSSQVKMVDVFTPANLYLGKQQYIFPETTRILRVAKRIIKGLFYHEYGRRLPPTHGVAARNLEDFSSSQQMVDLLLLTKPRNIGGEIFKFWNLLDPENENISAWLFYFFQGSPFLGITYDKSQNFVGFEEDEII